jgi:hypothetical protein
MPRLLHFGQRVEWEKVLLDPVHSCELRRLRTNRRLAARTRILNAGSSDASDANGPVEPTSMPAGQQAEEENQPGRFSLYAFVLQYVPKAYFE